MSLEAQGNQSPSPERCGEVEEYINSSALQSHSMKTPIVWTCTENMPTDRIPLLHYMQDLKYKQKADKDYAQQIGLISFCYLVSLGSGAPDPYRVSYSDQVISMQ